MKKQFFTLLFFFIILGACKNSSENKENKLNGNEQPSLDIEAVTYSKSDYFIPDELIPVSELAAGYTNEQAEYYRTKYSAPDIFTGNDITAFTYLNLSEVVPTALIRRGGPISELEIEIIPEIGDVAATTDLGTMTLKQAMADPRSRLQAIAVLHNGKIVYEEYPGMPMESQHLWSSTAKTIIGLLIYQLVAEGKIDLQSPVSAYLDFTKGTPIGAIKVEDVLHMRSGIDFEENQANRLNPEHPVSWAFAAALSPRGVPAGKSLKEIIVKVPVVDQPNQKYGYSTFNTSVLLWIIEEVTRKPWNQVVSDRIWKKAGMDNDALVALSPSGEMLGGGIFAGTLRDFMRYALLYTPSWNEVAKERVVPESFFQTIYKAVNPDIYLGGDQGPSMVKRFTATGAPIGNAYQWDAIFEDGDLYKSGLCGQALYVSPETNTVVVYFSSTWMNSQAMVPYTREIVKQVFR